MTPADQPHRSPARELLPYQIIFGLVSASIAGIVTVMGELRDQLGFSEGGVGIVVAAGFLASFCAQVGFAHHADRGHARTMATVGLAITAAALLTMVFVDQLGWWMAARAALGFGGGIAIPGIRRAATVLDPERVGENLGRLVVGEIVGFMVGPIAAAALAEVGGLRLPFLVFGLAVAGLAPMALRLPADRGAIDTQQRRSSFDLLKIRRLQGALLFVASYFLTIGAFESVIPLMFSDRGGTTFQTGIAFTVLAAPIAIASPMAGRTADRVGPPLVATVGISVVAVSTMFYGFVPGVFGPAAVMAVAGFAEGFGFVAAQIAVSRSVPEVRQAAALGLMGAVEVLSAGLSSFPAAALYGEVGEDLTWIVVGLSSLSLVALARLRLRGTTPVNEGGADLRWTPIDRHPEPEIPDEH